MKRAIVVFYEGRRMSDNERNDLALKLTERGIVFSEKFSISEFDQKEIESLLVKKILNENSNQESKISEVEYALIYLNQFFDKLGKGITEDPLAFGVAIASLKDNMPDEMMKAIDIITSNNIKTSLLKKYNFSTAHVTMLKKIYKLLKNV
nr:MAG TPA: hypothetical protein [Caudoviricetes sp.]